MPRIFHRLSDFDEEYGNEIPKQSVVYHGNFSCSYLYYLLREWLIENDWCPRSEPEFRETFYEQRETAAGDEIWVHWEFDKESSIMEPGDPNFRYELDIIMHIMFLKDVEVMVEGSREKIQNGEITVKIEARQIFKKKGWDSGWMKVLKPYIWRRYYLDKKDDVEGVMIQETQELQKVIRQYFELVQGENPEYQAFFKTGSEGK